MSNMKYTNSPLVDYVKLSPNYDERNHAIDTITYHHMAGNLSVETCGNVFAPASRRASSNYGIGSDGRIGMYVEEQNRSWCSSSRENDHRSITIEIANDEGAPNWHVSDAAIEAAIKLSVDICRRNNIKRLLWSNDKSLVGQVDKQNVTIHQWFSATNCPGPYLHSKIEYIVAEVNKVLDAENSTLELGTYTTKEEFIEQIAQCVNAIREEFGIYVASPIIAQACLESAYGTSNKAANHNNFFGLKYRKDRCPSACSTFVDGSAEQLEDGSYVPITDQWFEFQNMEKGVKGYFEFINIDRYAALKGVTDPRKYLELIKEAGYATSHDYVENVYDVIEKWNLTQYDTEPVVDCADYLVKMNSAYVVIRSEPNESADIAGAIIDMGTYTIVETSGNWGKLKSGAGWISLLDCTYVRNVGAAKPVEGATSTSTPTQPTQPTQPKKSAEDIAYEIYHGKGNWGNGQDRRNNLEAAGYNYAEVQAIVNAIMAGTYRKAEEKPQPVKKSIQEIAEECRLGRWGNGQDRKNALEAAGYNYAEVQAAVNKLYKK